MDATTLRRRRSWSSGLLIAAIICGILGAPFLAARLLPPTEAGRIGVFERIVQTVPGSEARAGHFAPTGWFWGAKPGSGTYFSADRASTAHITVHTNVDNPETLLRESLPLGATLAPSTTLPTRNGLTGESIEYDLASGDNPALSVTVCTTAAPRTCLLVRASFSSSMEEQRDEARRDIQHLIDGIEIIP